MDWLYSIAGTVLVIHYFFDTHYYFRVFLHCFCSRYVFKRIKFMEPSSIYGICTTNDVDLALNHMNNARYLREFDFGRMDYGFRTRLMSDFIKRGGNFLVCGSSIRYRLSVRIFSPYKVVTKAVWWDEKFCYFEQRIVTLADGIVRAVAYTKIATVINMKDYVKEMFPDLERPDPPEDLALWIQSHEVNRKNMQTNNSHKD